MKVSQTKGIRKMSNTSVQIEFQFKGNRCRERIKICDNENWESEAKELRDRILRQVAAGTFDYPGEFQNSMQAYRLTGEPRPSTFRKTFATCATCGRSFEAHNSKQAWRSKKGNVYCSPYCAANNRPTNNYPIPDWALTLLKECRRRASRKKIDFTLTDEEFRSILLRSGWRCELSGIEFEFEQATRRGPHRPYSPSLDRIDSMKGYTRDNVRLVCLAVNIAMNTWGDSVLISIAKGIAERHRIFKE